MISLKICMQNLRKLLSNKRSIMCVALAVLFVYTYTNGLGVLAVSLGKKMSPWVFPFLCTYRYMKIIYSLLLCFIFCDAPFIDSNQTYIMLRTSRKKWCMGQILYIFAVSFMYLFILLIASVLFNIRNMQWSSTWGDVLGTAGTTSALTSLGYGYNTVKVSSLVIRYFSPIQAMFFSFFIMWLSFVLLGMIIYAFNVLTKSKLVGMFIASALVLLTALVDLNPTLIWISPISWNTINNIRVGDILSTFPDITFVLSIYVVMIVILIVMSILLCKKQEMIVREEDW